MIGIIPIRAIDIILVSFIIFGFLLFSIKGINFFNKRIILLLTFGMFFVLLSAIPRGEWLALQGYWTLYVLRFFAILIFCFFLFKNKSSLMLFSRYLQWFIFITFFLAAAFLAGYDLVGVRLVAWNYRLNGFGNPNYFAFAIGIIIAMQLGFLLEKSPSKPYLLSRRNYKNYNILPLFLLLIAILWTGSRGALLAVLGVLFSVIFHSTIKSMLSMKMPIAKFKTIIVLNLFLFLSVFIYHLFQSDLEVLLRLQDLAEGRGSGRDQIWSAVLGNIDWGKWTAYLGHGGSAGFTLFGQKENLSGTHNDYIWLLADFGLIGLGVFIISYIFLMRALFKTREYGLFYSLLFTALFIVSNDVVNGSPFALLIGISLAALRWRKQMSDAIKLPGSDMYGAKQK